MGKAEETRTEIVPESLRPTETPAVEVGPGPFAESDGFEVRNKKEGYEYRWLNRAEHNVNRRKLLGGYEVVGSADLEDAGVKSADGTRVNGDLILGRRPIPVGDEKRARIIARQKVLEGQPAAQFHQMAEEANREARDAGMTGAGVTTFETDEAGQNRPSVTRPHRKNWKVDVSFDAQGNVVR